MLAAGHAALRGRKVILIDKGPRLGRKVLVCGGGRCNISNTGTVSDYVARYGRQGRFLYPAFSRFFSTEILELLHKEGVQTKVENAGRIFPKSDRAGDVVEALERWLLGLGVEVRLNTALNAIETDEAPSSEPDKPPTRWVSAARTNGGTIPASAVIVCLGGKSYPKLGTTGDGYAIARQLGHTVIPTYPCQVGLHSSAPVLKTLQGISLQGVVVSALDASTNKRISRAEGDVVFTHFGISGPAILNVSRDLVEGLARGQHYTLLVDLLPQLSDPNAAILEEASQAPRKHAANLLREWLPNKMAAPLLYEAQVEPERMLGQLTREQRQALVQLLKGLKLPVTGSEGYDRAIVTKGGVSLKEINPNTMESRLVKGLYFAGELLDIDGPTGGYNLQAAFSTGWLAGGNA